MILSDLKVSKSEIDLWGIPGGTQCSRTSCVREREREIQQLLVSCNTPYIHIYTIHTTTQSHNHLSLSPQGNGGERWDPKF